MVVPGGTGVLTSGKGRVYKNGSINGSEWCQTLHRGKLSSLEGHT